MTPVQIAFVIGLVVGFLPPFVALLIDILITRRWQPPEIIRRQVRDETIDWMVRNSMICVPEARVRLYDKAVAVVFNDGSRHDL